MTQSPNGEILAYVSDLHTNGTTGLCPPRFQLDDGGEYKASKAQRWLWRNWLDYWQQIAQLGKDTGLPIAAVIGGDIHDGDHHDTPQIITRNQIDQLRIAVDVIEPVLEAADRLFVIRGTESHSGKSGWMEEALARDVSAVPAPEGNASWWHLYARFGGVTFDIQHHPESGSMRPWTSGNGANRISNIVMHDYVATGDPVPDVAIRSHKHRMATSGVHLRPFVVCSPAWQLKTAFVNTRIAAAGKINPVGGIYFICRDGRYTWDSIMYRPARRKPHEVSYADARQ